MSDGIIAISRREEETAEHASQEEKQANETKSIKRRPKKFAEFVVTDYGIKKEEVVVRKLQLRLSTWGLRIIILLVLSFPCQKI